MPSSNPFVTRFHVTLAVLAALLVAVSSPAAAAPSFFRGVLSGAAEVPPSASPGTGVAEVIIDPVAHTMQIHASYSGLLGITTACHIHAPTAVALTGTAGVATTTPAFVGFPLGAFAGAYSNTLDMTLASSYNASYVTANGGTTGSAEVALFSAIAAGKAYFNLHSTVVPGGEIRAFLVPFDPTPTAKTTWSRVKSLYH